LQDGVQNPFHGLVDFRIAEAQDAKSESLQVLVALLVIFSLVLVHTPIHFNHQTSFVAVKINDIGFNDLLTAKVKAFETIGPQA
jgi:hypothetical protein